MDAMKDIQRMNRAFARANRVVKLTVEEARLLPGLLGQVVPLELELRGWYAKEHDGVVTFYDRKRETP